MTLEKVQLRVNALDSGLLARPEGPPISIPRNTYQRKARKSSKKPTKPSALTSFVDRVKKNKVNKGLSYKGIEINSSNNFLSFESPNQSNQPINYSPKKPLKAANQRKLRRNVTSKIPKPLEPDEEERHYAIESVKPFQKIRKRCPIDTENNHQNQNDGGFSNQDTINGDSNYQDIIVDGSYDSAAESDVLISQHTDVPPLFKLSDSMISKTGFASTKFQAKNVKKKARPTATLSSVDVSKYPIDELQILQHVIIREQYLARLFKVTNTIEKLSYEIYSKIDFTDACELPQDTIKVPEVDAAEKVQLKFRVNELANLVVQIRSASIEVIQAIHMWRSCKKSKRNSRCSDSKAGASPDKRFVYKMTNYIIKMRTDSTKLHWIPAIQLLLNDATLSNCRKTIENPLLLTTERCGALQQELDDKENVFLTSIPVAGVKNDELMYFSTIEDYYGILKSILDEGNPNSRANVDCLETDEKLLFSLKYFKNEEIIEQNYRESLVMADTNESYDPFASISNFGSVENILDSFYDRHKTTAITMEKELRTLQTNTDRIKDGSASEPSMPHTISNSSSLKVNRTRLQGLILKRTEKEGKVLQGDCVVVEKDKSRSKCKLRGGKIIRKSTEKRMREKAVQSISKQFRSYIFRKTVFSRLSKLSIKINLSAINIQRCFRGFFGRKYYSKIREIYRIEQRLKNNASRLIQKFMKNIRKKSKSIYEVIRVNQMKRNIEAMEASSRLEQYRVAGELRRKQKLIEEDAQNRKNRLINRSHDTNITIIQANIRGYLGRLLTAKMKINKLTELHNSSATVIQKLFRGYACRKRYTSMVYNETYKLVNGYATTIQSVFRGHIARRDSVLKIVAKNRSAESRRLKFMHKQRKPVVLPQLYGKTVQQQMSDPKMKKRQSINNITLPLIPVSNRKPTLLNANFEAATHMRRISLVNPRQSRRLSLTRQEIKLKELIIGDGLLTGQKDQLHQKKK